MKYKDTQNFQKKLTKGNSLQNELSVNDYNSHNDVIILPFHKVNTFKGMGVIMHTSHHLMIPKTLNIGKIFTIFFRFYNPVINTDYEHCLLQNSKGKTLLAISEDKKNLITYSIDGEQIDSGILIDESNLNTWVSVGLSYIEQDNQTKLIFFFENERKRCYDNGENYKLTNNIAYIGNSKEFDKPFGTFCDLRVYRKAVDLNGYIKIKNVTEEDYNKDRDRGKNRNNEKSLSLSLSTSASKNNSNNTANDNLYKNGFDRIYYKINNDIMKIIISNFVYFSNSGNGKNKFSSNLNLNSNNDTNNNPYSNSNSNSASYKIDIYDNDNTEESFYYFIKLLNALLIKKEVRNSYIHNDLTFKLMEFINSKSEEIKKDITKFLKTIS